MNVAVTTINAIFVPICNIFYIFPFKNVLIFSGFIENYTMNINFPFCIRGSEPLQGFSLITTEQG